MLLRGCKLQLSIVYFGPLFNNHCPWMYSIQMHYFYCSFTYLYYLLFLFLAAIKIKSKCIFYFLSTWFWSQDLDLLFSFLNQEGKVKSKWNSQIYFWIYFFTLLLFADVHNLLIPWQCQDWLFQSWKWNAGLNHHSYWNERHYSSWIKAVSLF